MQQTATPILELKREFAKGFAGSPAFIAPEVIRGEPAKGFASDWYSLGVCIFRLASGRLPYEASSTDQVLVKGRDGRVSWERLPRTGDPLLLDLIVGLLEQDAGRRYGARGGARHLMRHPYFSGMDFDSIYAEASPLIDRELCVEPGGRECFADRGSAVDFISYARGLVAGMPLGPKYATVGGWRGMPVEEDAWWDAADRPGDGRKEQAASGQEGSEGGAGTSSMHS